MKKNRVLTESEVYFPRCVALPARETLLLEEEMMLYMGQSGSVTSSLGTSRRGSKTNPTPAVTFTTGMDAVANLQASKEVEDLSRMAVAGVIPTGRVDSSAVSVRSLAQDARNVVVDTSGSAPTNSGSQTEDTSESLWDTVKGWFGS